MTAEISVEISSATPDEWDEFAALSKASYRCLYRAASLWRFETEALSRIRRLSLFVGEGTGRLKIGQCALSIGSRCSVFQDSLQLMPEYADKWADAMQAVLRFLGTGNYIYGSDWNLEKCRESEVGAIDGATVTSVWPVDIVAVDFRDWASWDDYYKAVSTNAKRNVKKAIKTYDNLEIRRSRGWPAFGDIIALEKSRHRLFARKNVKSSLILLLLRTGFRQVATLNYSAARCLVDGQNPLAYFLDIKLGTICFYLEAASDYGSSGASAYLLKSVIEIHFQATEGQGVFIFGPDDHRQAGDPIWEGLVRSRQQWKAKAYPTSVLQFSYSGT